MKTSLRFTHIVAALFAVLMSASAALAADPGLSFPITTVTSDQKAGSLLFFNIYTSSATNPSAQNTRLNFTNTSDQFPVAVHLFFVDGGTCSIADRYICLTPNQTTTFLASEQDPGTTGDLVAMAVNFDGTPAFHNFLIGDEYVKFESGHFASLGAEAYTKINGANELSPDGSLAALFFDGIDLAGSYSRTALVLAIDNIGSRGDGNDTLLILNRIGGNFTTTGASLGALFGLLYNDQEEPHSFNFTGGCQFRSLLTNTFPRTTPRFDVVIPSGQTGWMKFYSTSGIGISGAVINRNPNAATSSGAFNEGHNLHKLKLAASSLTVPVFPPNCGFVQPL